MKEDIYILGAPFIRKYYAVFDMDHKQIGLVLAKKVSPGILNNPEIMK